MPNKNHKEQGSFGLFTPPTNEKLDSDNSMENCEVDEHPEGILDHNPTSKTNMDLIFDGVKSMDK